MRASRVAAGRGRASGAVVVAASVAVALSLLGSALLSFGATAGGPPSSGRPAPAVTGRADRNPTAPGASSGPGISLSFTPAGLLGPAASDPLQAQTPVPSAPKIDPGQSVSLNVSVTGGVPPYTYVWYSGTYPQCSGDHTLVGHGPELNASAAFGSLYYCYTVNDSEAPPVSAMPTNAALVTVEPALAAGGVTPASPTIDAGQTVTLTSHPGGGAGSYTITWFSNTTGSSLCTLKELGTGATWPAVPTGNTTYCYGVTDSSVGTPPSVNYSAPDVVTVDPKLTVGPVEPVLATVDSGQSLVLTASPSGGTGPGTYTLQWYTGSSTTCSASLTPVGTNATTYTATPPSTTNYCYSVKDAAYGESPIFSSTDSVKVNGKLTANSPKPGGPSLDLGQSITFTVSVAGGTGPYSYQWYSGFYSTCSLSTASPVAGQYNSTYTESPNAGGSYICYSVTDSASNPVTTFSPGDLVTVNQPLSAGSPSPAAETIDYGQPATLTANPAAGTPPYSYKWFYGPSSSCTLDINASGTSKSIAPAPKVSTYYCYELFDSANGTPASSVYSSTVLVSVNSALTALAPIPLNPSIDKGQSITLTAEPQGGTPVYIFQWLTGSPCTSAIHLQTSSTLTVAPLVNTTYCYVLTDGSQNPPTRTSPSDTITVYPTLLAGAALPTNASIDSGQSLVLTANASEGKPPYTYQWYSSPTPACSSGSTPLGTSKTQTVTPASSTYYCYFVTDNVSLVNPGRNNSTADLVKVNPPLADATLSSNSTILDLDQGAILLARATGGTLPYHYLWYTGSSSNCSLDTTVVKGTTFKQTVKPSALTTTLYYCVVVEDSSKGTPTAVNASAAYHLTVDPALENEAISPIQPDLNLGQYVVLVGNASGGTPPLQYQWYTSKATPCVLVNSTKVKGATGETLNVTPTSTAYYCLLVTDGSNGVPAESVFSPADLVTVNLPPGPSLLGLPLVEGAIVLGVLLGIFALIVLAVVLRIRKVRRARGPGSDFL